LNFLHVLCKKIKNMSLFFAYVYFLETKNSIPCGYYFSQDDAVNDLIDTILNNIDSSKLTLTKEEVKEHVNNSTIRLHDFVIKNLNNTVIFNIHQNYLPRIYTYTIVNNDISEVIATRSFFDKKEAVSALIDEIMEIFNYDEDFQNLEFNIDNFKEEIGSNIVKLKAALNQKCYAGYSSLRWMFSFTEGNIRS
jgi:hypothetical protein